jgi:hypothetical protein
MVAAGGGVFTFGDAGFHGSAGGLKLNKPVVGVGVTPSGGGYVLAAADGGVFAYGDALFAGSAGGLSLNKPVVASCRRSPAWDTSSSPPMEVSSPTEMPASPAVTVGPH